MNFSISYLLSLNQNGGYLNLTSEQRQAIIHFLQSNRNTSLDQHSPEQDASYVTYTEPGFVDDAYHISLDQYVLERNGLRRQALSKVIPITIVYCILFVTGVVGNLCTCIVIARNRYMHTATNYYLFNLAISDLLVLILNLPQETYTFWSAYPWIFGEVFCFIRSMAAETCTCASILTITAFTIERYVAICHPMKAQTTPNLSRAVKVIIVIWIVSTVSAIPLSIQFGVGYVINPYTNDSIPESAKCTIIPSRRIPHTFEMSAFLFFCFPMSAITVMYSLIAWAIRRSTLNRCGSDSSSHSESDGTEFRSHRQIKSRRAVLKMLVAVVLAFFLCWAPFHSQRLMTVYMVSFTPTLKMVHDVLFYISGVLLYVSSTINPILYSIMSLKFRQAFKSTVCRPCRRRKKTRFSYTYKFTRSKSHTSDQKYTSSSEGSGYRCLPLNANCCNESLLQSSSSSSGKHDDDKHAISMQPMIYPAHIRTTPQPDQQSSSFDNDTQAPSEVNRIS